MNKAWTTNLKDPKEIQDFEVLVNRAKPVLDRLKFLTEQKQAGLEGVELSIQQYDNPNWASRQAHINGYKDCVRDILRLISLDPKEHNERPIQYGRRPHP